MPAPPLFETEDLRPIALWAADCAERSLAIFEVLVPDDIRPREAIIAARAFAHSGRRTAALRQFGWAAHAAAQEAGSLAAAAAARAACAAAAVAYTHPIATPHQVNHFLSPAVYAAYANALSLADEAAGEQEICRSIEQASPAVRHLVQQMPRRVLSKSPLGKLFFQLDTDLRR